MVYFMICTVGAFGLFVIVDEVDFTADEGFDIIFFCGLEEVDDAEEVSMVGEGESLHAEAFSFCAKAVDSTGAV